MGMQLPGWLRQALEYAGYDWPATDESVLFDWAQQWNGLANQAAGMAAQARSAVGIVTAHNSGEGANAFADFMNSPDSNIANLANFGKGANAIGIGCNIVAGIVVTLKLAVIAQLVTLAAAIASAVATAGLASGAALAAREVAKRLIEAAINIAVEQIMGG